MKPDKNEGPIRLVLADVDRALMTQEKVLTGLLPGFTPIRSDMCKSLRTAYRSGE
jgi:hypothetical protein